MRVRFGFASPSGSIVPFTGHFPVNPRANKAVPKAKPEVATSGFLNVFFRLYPKIKPPLIIDSRRSELEIVPWAHAVFSLFLILFNNCSIILLFLLLNTTIDFFEMFCNLFKKAVLFKNETNHDEFIRKEILRRISSF